MKTMFGSEETFRMGYADGGMVKYAEPWIKPPP
jgi:hypothetical protein